MKRILCALCVSLIGWQALASEVDDNLKKLEAALQKAPKEQGKNMGDSEDSESPSRMNLSSIVPMLRANIAQSDLNSSAQMLQQLASSPQLSAEAQKAIQELLSTLIKEQETREKAAVTKIEDALKHAAAAVKNAKTPADLDAVLQELAAVKNRTDTRRYSEEMQALRNKVESTYRFVARWQDYLVAQAAGNSENCRNILRDLANLDTLLMPRSELLAKAEVVGRSNAEPNKPEQPIEEIADEMIGKTKNLDGLNDLIKELHRLENQRRSGNYNSGKLQSYLQSLEEINRRYREFQAGLATSLDMPPTPASITPLKAQLFLLLLPRCIGAPDGVKPKSGEGVDAFLTRMEQEAKARGDIALGNRTRTVLRQMQHFSPFSRNDDTALNNFQAAQNQEAAGQYMLAVGSYQEALKNGSDAVPAKLIGERLADIKKMHPEDFEKGMDRFLNPPPSRSTASYFAGRYPIGMPGMPTPPPEAPTKLLVPAASPSPSTAAATPSPTATPALSPVQ